MNQCAPRQGDETIDDVELARMWSSRMKEAAMAKVMGGHMRTIRRRAIRIGLPAKRKEIWDQNCIRAIESGKPTIGGIIKATRLRRNMTVEEIAELCSVTPSTVYFWEKSARILPKNFPALAKSLRISQKKLEVANGKNKSCNSAMRQPRS